MTVTATMLAVDQDFDRLVVKVEFASDVSSKKIVKTYTLRRPDEMTTAAVEALVRDDKDRIEALEASLPALESQVGQPMNVG